MDTELIRKYTRQLENMFLHNEVVVKPLVWRIGNHLYVP